MNIIKTLILPVLVIAAASCGEQPLQQAKQPVRVATELLGAATTGAGRSYVGIIEENEATAVSFTGMGVVKQMLVNEGQYVSRGQLIAVMDDTQARNMLAGAEAQLAQAQDALERYRMLHDNGSLPEVQWVEIQSKVAQAVSQVEVVKKNLADCRLTAPVSGVVGRKMVGAGETAMPGQAVVSILDISTVKVKVSLPETEVAAVTASTPSTINVEAAGKIVAGGRIEKGVQADALTHTYDVRITVHNPDRKLLPGMVADVTLDTGKAGAALTLPLTAVQRRAGGELFVWTVAVDSTAHRAPVNIGATIGNRVIVAGGIKQGDRVVTEGYQKLGEGSKVIY
ncbi:MAG: efflux RND transporter periplasmic adaptor subunit [Muribaculaceae bacterium]|nr:efflux RND transporter periplasmic adaptor subunit [Muribaculaceae bacterium]